MCGWYLWGGNCVWMVLVSKCVWMVLVVWLLCVDGTCE